jgi:hypothetical protein
VGQAAGLPLLLFYVMTTGQRSTMINDPYIELVYDSSLNAWRFNDKRANA